MSADKKSVAIGRPMLVLTILLVVFILAMLVSLYYVGTKRSDLQKHIELAAEQLLLSQQMATFSLGASSGKEVDFGSLLESRLRFDAILETYRSGDPMTGAPVLAKDLAPVLDAVETSWRKYRGDIEVIINGKQPISEVGELYNVIDSFIPQMLTYSDEVVGVLMEKNASTSARFISPVDR